MKLGFLYAGQGSQRVGMGSDFYDKYPEFKKIFDEITLDFDIKRLCFEGPEEQLGQTEFTQPCMVAFAGAVTKMLYAEGIKPEVAAGLSLGEYSALCAAGVFDIQTAVELTAFRGRVMADAAKDRDCAMSAIMKLDRETVQQVCFESRDKGIAEVANYNCPDQIVIGGDKAAVDKACALAKIAGAARCIPLKVSGPFHTSLLKNAGDALQERFKSIEFKTPNFPVIFNCTGKFLTEGETIPKLLVRQVQNSVYLEDSIRVMENIGINTIIEIGPGKVLSSFVKKTAKSIRTIPIETADEFETAVSFLKGELLR